ncbi:hypothetical protein L3476_08750 [Paenibacillus thiaminolyticus]|uniref:hypothetical protein n=1 Tax=Paenibacillus thiaminolyticus TaxID=49283 RepID=UPI0013F61142|nr:hypothetical protein [Paenibacillus thiaminolyticus]NGP59036.1 hypothetical protein [Paenibacillus thiaminolyticus]WCR28796.1 hypothetical protein L3476_08750 [Paenibacillus thiaminolyticus]
MGCQWNPWDAMGFYGVHRIHAIPWMGRRRASLHVPYCVAMAVPAGTIQGVV